MQSCFLALVYNNIIDQTVVTNFMHDVVQLMMIIMISRINFCTYTNNRINYIVWMITFFVCAQNWWFFLSTRQRCNVRVLPVCSDCVHWLLYYTTKKEVKSSNICNNGRYQSKFNDGKQQSRSCRTTRIRAIIETTEHVQ